MKREIQEKGSSLSTNPGLMLRESKAQDDSLSPAHTPASPPGGQGLMLHAFRDMSDLLALSILWLCTAFK